MLFSRPDGERIADLPLLRRFMPFLLRGRNESAVYLDQQIDVGATLAWLASYNDGRPPVERITFYHVVLAALVRTLAERPRLNRFVSGGRIWQRKGLSIAFAVKKQLADHAQMTTVKVEFGADDDLHNVAQRVREAIGQGRGAARTTSEKEMVVVTAMPGFVLRAVMALQRWADRWNLLPAAMLKGDPLYSSVFVANLGSVGLEAPFHHLFEYGNTPIFVTIGRIKKAPVVRADDTLGVATVVHCKYSFDERIADGFYCARSLELLRGYIADAAALDARGPAS